MATVSLRGDAAKAFLDLSGLLPEKNPKPEKDQLMEVATAVFLAMKTHDHAKAIEILKTFKAQPKKRTRKTT